MLDEFTYSEYRELLDLLDHDRENLTFADFGERDAPERYYILRHDIDFSMAAALEMAQVESDHGARATYFLLLGCEHYNLLSEEWATAPRKMVQMGHEVGLHYDVRAMAKRHEGDFQAALRYETAILAELTGAPVRSIAMHNPSVYGDNPFGEDTGFISTYEPRFTKEIAYYSDSCGAWRDHTFADFSTGGIPGRVQFLTHPIFWREETGDRWERLEEWKREQSGELDRIASGAREIWRNHSGVREHDQRLGRE